MERLTLRSARVAVTTMGVIRTAVVSFLVVSGGVRFPWASAGAVQVKSSNAATPPRPNWQFDMKPPDEFPCGVFIAVKR